MDHNRDSFTWAGWVNLRSFYDDQSVVAKWNNNALPQREYRLNYDATRNRWIFDLSRDGFEGAGSSVTVVHPTEVQLDTWYFLEAWYDADSNTAHLRVSTQAARGADASEPFTGGVQFSSADLNLAAHNTCSDDFLDGFMDAWGYWTRTLTEAESRLLWNNGQGFEVE